MLRPATTLILFAAFLAAPIAAQRRSLEVGDGKVVEFELLSPGGERPAQALPLLVCLETSPLAAKIGSVKVEGTSVDLGGILGGTGLGGIGQGLESLAASARDHGMHAVRVFPAPDRPFAGPGIDDIFAVVDKVASEVNVAATKVALAGTGVDGWTVLAAAAGDRCKAVLAAPAGDPGAASLGMAHRTPIFLCVAKSAPAAEREPLMSLVARQQAAGARIDQADEPGLSVGPAMAWLEDLFFGSVERSEWELRSGDGLPVFADFYDTGDKRRPVVLCVHDRNSSAGDFARLAPRLVRAGFNVVAVDHREGGVSRGGAANRTVDANRGKSALKGLFGIMRRDIEAAIEGTRRKGYRGPLVLLGDSAAASECLVIGSKSSVVRGLILFSPQDNIADKGGVARAAENLKSPCLFTCPRHLRADVQHLSDQVPAKDKVFLPRDDGITGVACIEGSKEGESVFRAMTAFLGRLR